MSDDDGGLRPEDLRLDDDRVRTLEDGRLVISTDEEPATGGSGTSASQSSARGARRTPGDLTAFLPDEAAYELAVAARTDRGTAGTTVGSNDIREAFTGLLRWYAGQVEPELPAEAVLATLVEASELSLAVERTDE